MFDEEDKVFYILSNKFGPESNQKLGFYVLKIEMGNPSSGYFMIKWKNKLDIDDCNIQVLRGQGESQAAREAIGKGGMKEVIISFKSIYVNTYNVICMDISDGMEGKKNKKKLVFRHERFQLWESEI